MKKKLFFIGSEGPVSLFKLERLKGDSVPVLKATSCSRLNWNARSAGGRASEQASNLDLLREFEDSSVHQRLNLGMARF